MSSVNIGGKSFNAVPQGRGLGRSPQSDRLINSTAFASAGGAVTNMAVTLGTFQLPKSAYVRKIVLSGYHVVNSTGLYQSVSLRMQLQTVATPYNPPVSTLTPTTAFDMFKSNQEGTIEINFQEKSLFIPAARTIGLVCEAFGSFAVSDLAVVSLYIGIELE